MKPSFALVALALPLTAQTQFRVPRNIDFPASPQVMFAAGDIDGDVDLEFPLIANMLRQIQAPVPMVRGSTYVLEVFRRPGSVGAVAIFGALDAGSQRLPFGDLRLDPATAVTLAVRFGMPSQMGLPLQIPNNPALVGTALHYQAIVEDPLVGLVLTNAIREVLQ
jgi:hypothetical protein